MALTSDKKKNEYSHSEIEYFVIPDFDRSLRKAFLGGGQSQKRATKVKVVLGSLREKDPFVSVSVTNHGENRISNCVKYDLGDGWRLVTQQGNKTCVFLFVGDHEDVEKWLEGHKGLRAAVQKNKQAILLPGVGQPIVTIKTAFSDQHSEPLCDRLDSQAMDHVLRDLPRSLSRKLEALDGRSTTIDLDELIKEIADKERAELVQAVFRLLMTGDEDGARAHVDVSMGRADLLEDLDSVIEVRDGENVRRLKIGSSEYENWLAAFERQSAWHEWFLYLHPEQEKVVETNYDGPAQLSGVSGSGKTCVAVRRALRLAENHHGRVLVLTLNRSLAKLIERLVDSACLDKTKRARIEVTSFFELAQRLLFEFEPENVRLYTDVTWKLGEHVDEVFREYYRRWANSNAADVLFALHVSLTARKISAETYLREEFDWIRSAVAPESRSEYLSIERKGRRFPLLADRRADVLQGLEGWERKMRDVGVIDYLGLTSLLARHLDHIHPRYTNVLVDEAQDFGTTELAIIKKLVPSGPNDIFLCGDVAQSILPKHRSLSVAGLTNVARERIQKNYRNSREILKAAYEVLKNNLHEDLIDSDDLEILDPKYANFGGAMPMALAAESLKSEIVYARSYAATALQNGVKSVCIVFAGFSSRDIRSFAAQCGVTALDGTYNPSTDSVVFSDLEQCKGYEFETLIIVNCCEGVLPPYDAPAEEAYRASCKLYVAMTRAKRELILSFHGTASSWIIEASETIGAADWNEFEKIDHSLLTGIPDRLPEFEPDREIENRAKLTGVQFVYAAYSLGISVEAQEKLVELVDGRGLRSVGGRRRKWKDMGTLISDLNNGHQHDAVLGPAVADELRKLSISS